MLTHETSDLAVDFAIGFVESRNMARNQRLRTRRPRVSDAAPPTVPRPFELHWGKGQIVEEARIESQYHVPAIQLLEFESGEIQIRFCYFNHKGQFQRGPLILGRAEVEALRSALKKCPRLRATLKELLR